MVDSVREQSSAGPLMEEKEMNNREEAVRVCLCPLSREDPLFAEKQRLMDMKNLKCDYLLSVRACAEEIIRELDQMVQATRISYMNETELYFSGGDDVGPLSPRNELESLNSLLTIITSLVSSYTGDGRVLDVLKSSILGMIKHVGENGEHMVAKVFDAHAEESLLKWGENHGVQTKLKIAYFEGAGRGAVALEDINAGKIALEIPEYLLISEDLVQDSDMFSVLKELDGITLDTMLLLWSMRERYNPSSKYKTYFDTLPREFNTGLSFGVHALKTLEGTLLLEELLHAKEHLRKQFDDLFPALSDGYPSTFKEELYTWDKYLWACELWYSNSMKVAFADGKLRTCLIPIVGFLNHSVCPHILHYGRVDPATRLLKFHVSRPCGAGEQCFLSYGNFPSSHLVTFYGFLPKGDNPYDVIPLDFDAPESDDNDNLALTGETQRTTHMVRGTWLSKIDKPYSYGLPPRLLDYLRATLRGDEFDLPSGTSKDDISKEIETSVLETILSIFTPMLQGLGDSDDIYLDNCSWDVKLALDYKDLQKRIISSIINSCNSGLQMLDTL